LRLLLRIQYRICEVLILSFPREGCECIILAGRNVTDPRVHLNNMAETRLTPEIELDGLSPDEAFAVLGDETRLKIIRVLWRAGAFHEYD